MKLLKTAIRLLCYQFHKKIMDFRNFSIILLITPARHVQLLRNFQTFDDSFFKKRLQNHRSSTILFHCIRVSIMVSTLNNAFAACTPPMSPAFVDWAVRSRGEMHLLFFFFLRLLIRNVRRDFPCILYLPRISYLAFKSSFWSCFSRNLHWICIELF